MTKIQDLGKRKFERPDLKGLLKPETIQKDRKNNDNLLRKIPSVPRMDTGKKKASISKYKNVYEKGGSIFVKFRADRFVLFQSTIVASLPLQDGSDYLIHPSGNIFVNSNGDCWDNKTLLGTYQTFIGAPACLDHPDDQDIDNKGVILDAVLRRRILDRDYGTYNYYVDILVAIDKEQDSELADKILKRQIKYMSMGCVIDKGYCSRCGHEVDYIKEPEDLCDHLKYQKGQTFVDNVGEKRVVGELLGRDGKGVKFIEASVLSEPPAFQGAFASRIFVVSTDLKYIIKELPRTCLDSLALQKYMFIKG